MSKVRRTLGDWLETAIWPGVSTQVQHEELRARARVVGPDGRRTGDRTITLVKVSPSAEIDPELVFRSDGYRRALVVGSGTVDLTCGDCGFAICEKVGQASRFAGVIMACPGCSTWQRLAQSVRSDDVRPGQPT